MIMLICENVDFHVPFSVIVFLYNPWCFILFLSGYITKFVFFKVYDFNPILCCTLDFDVLYKPFQYVVT